VRDDARVSIGLCLRYGAPGQSKAAFGRALDEVLAWQPGRIQIQHIAAAPGQAHGRAAHAALPRARLPMLRWIAARLLEAGYSRVAGDYYARPADVFGIAQRRARLGLRPYGLSAEGGHTTIALGPAAIGAVGSMYYQNQRNAAHYMALLARDELPVMRGVGLSADDLVRRSVIHSLSCNLFVDIEALTLAFGIDFERHFAAEQPLLRELERAGLIVRSAGAIEIVGDGLLLVDNVCMVFDAHLRRRHLSGPYRAPL
jgi:oxygen-independent coproporphyrinogen-3 oxidase